MKKNSPNYEQATPAHWLDTTDISGLRQAFFDVSATPYDNHAKTATGLTFDSNPVLYHDNVWPNKNSPVAISQNGGGDVLATPGSLLNVGLNRLIKLHPATTDRDGYPYILCNGSYVFESFGPVLDARFRITGNEAYAKMLSNTRTQLEEFSLSDLMAPNIEMAERSIRTNNTRNSSSHPIFLISKLIEQTRKHAAERRTGQANQLIDRLTHLEYNHPDYEYEGSLKANFTILDGLGMRHSTRIREIFSKVDLTNPNEADGFKAVVSGVASAVQRRHDMFKTNNDFFGPTTEAMRNAYNDFHGSVNSLLGIEY